MSEEIKKGKIRLQTVQTDHDWRVESAETGWPRPVLILVQTSPKHVRLNSCQIKLHDQPN